MTMNKKESLYFKAPSFSVLIILQFFKKSICTPERIFKKLPIVYQIGNSAKKQHSTKTTFYLYSLPMGFSEL